MPKTHSSRLTSIDFAKDVLDGENLVDLDDLDEARGNHDELSKKKDALSEFKARIRGINTIKFVQRFCFHCLSDLAV